MITAMSENDLVNNSSNVYWLDIIVYSQHALVTLLYCSLFWCSVALRHSLIGKKLLEIGYHPSLSSNRKELEQSCGCEVGRSCRRCNGRLAVLGGRNNTRRGESARRARVLAATSVKATFRATHHAPPPEHGNLALV